MTAKTDIAAVSDGGENTAADVRNALTSVWNGTVIHQLDDRSWSAAVADRDSDDPRVEFRGWDDPDDATFGVSGREFITDLDVWLDLNQFGITPPWE